MPHALDAAVARQWASTCVRTLELHREEIDGINVFPVADRDTGTNLLRTMRAAHEAAARVAADDPRAVWSALASGALAGACGNSGVILSQVLRGFAEVLASTPAELRSALHRADELAGRAVSQPAPGTMLTVLHAAATAAGGVEGAVAEVATIAARVAAQALAATTDQLDVLARAGVVDAGGQGLVFLLDALVTVVTGRAPAPPEPPAAPRTPRPAALLSSVREAGSDQYGYEVMYSLDQVDEAVAESLRTALLPLGDCVSVVGDGAGRWAVHVHCNDVGAAIEAGVEAGRPRRISVVRFADQVAPVSRFSRERAVLGLVRGAGLARLFRAEGAGVLELPATGLPTVADVAAALADTQAAHVTVLSAGPDLAAVLDGATRRVAATGQDVLVVPTSSPVQGLAALAVHDPGRRPGEDAVAMAEAAAATRRGELVLAAEEGITWVGRCHPGDLLGLLDGEVVLIEPGPATEPAVLAGARRLLDRMLSAGGELVTALTGSAAPPALVTDLAEYLRTEHREVEFSHYPGGQADSVLLLGVE